MTARFNATERVGRAAPVGICAGASRPILVIESDRDTGLSLSEQLAADGYRVALARTSEHARTLARASAPRLVVLGSFEAPRGALALLEEIRASAHTGVRWEKALPAIVIGSTARELDVLRAFEAGADDFLGGEAGYLELRARLQAVLRRVECAAGGTAILEVGELVVDTQARTVSVRGQGVALRRLEFELLVHLAREPERVFTRGELLRAVWGYRADGSTRTVDSHASRLRRKLDRDGGRCWLITVWGVGYRLI